MIDRSGTGQNRKPRIELSTSLSTYYRSKK